MEMESSHNHKVIEENKKNASATIEITVEEDVKIKNLLKWILENGGESVDLEMKYTDVSNRFYVASKLIKRDEIINIIPERVLITKNVPEIQKYYDILSKIPCFEEYIEQISICAWVSSQYDNPQCFFKPYFDYLPKDFSGFPFYYHDDELAILKGTSFLNQVLSKKRQLLAEIEELKKVNEIAFNPDYYVKFRHMFYSRNFWITIGSTSLSAAIPLGDNYNYIPNRVNVKWVFDNERKAIVISAKNDIKKGEEIILDYGFHRNNHFLLYSGFTLKGNKGIEGVLCYSEVSNHPDIDMWDVDINKAIKRYRNNGSKFCQSFEDEKEALTIAENKLKEIISNYQTSLEQDQKLLQEGERTKSLSYNKINMLRVMIEEKRLVSAYYKAIEFFLKLFDCYINKDNEKINRMQKTIQSNQVFSLYFNTINSQLKIETVSVNSAFKDEDEEDNFYK